MSFLFVIRTFFIWKKKQLGAGKYTLIKIMLYLRYKWFIIRYCGVSKIFFFPPPPPPFFFTFLSRVTSHFVKDFVSARQDLLWHNGNFSIYNKCLLLDRLTFNHLVYIYSSFHYLFSKRFLNWTATIYKYVSTICWILFGNILKKMLWKHIHLIPRVQAYRLQKK